MLKHLLSKKLTRLSFVCALFVAAVACSTEGEDSPEYIRQENEGRFDFNLQQSKNIEISIERPALVCIYGEKPTETDDTQPLYAAFTDHSGRFNGRMSLPGGFTGKTLYAKIYDNVFEVRNDGDTYSLNLTAEESSDSETLEEMCYRLNDEYKGYLNESNPANYEKILNKDGNVRIRTTQPQTTFTAAFVFSGASFGSKLYYYYYPTNENPREYFETLAAAEGKEPWEYIAEKFMTPEFQIFKSRGNDGSIWSAWVDKKHKDFSVGASQPLLFYGADYGDEGICEFPAGYTVAFFQKAGRNSFGSGTRTLKTRPVFSESWLNTYADSDFSENYFDEDFENRLLSQNMSDRNAHVKNGGHVQAGMFKGTHNRALILGFEDLPDLWIDCDHDYNDNIFAIMMTPFPEDAEVPEIPDDNRTGVEYSVGTLLFEDLFPSEGDYDMNDVVIKYTRIKRFDKDNMITSIEYEYYPVSPAENAKCTSDFYLMINDDDRMIMEPRLIFSNHKKSYNKRFAGKFIPAEPVHKDAITWDMFNPYILVKESNHEVHLAKKRFAGTGSGYEDLDERRKAYLTDPKGMSYFYSFALDVPYSLFEIVTEGVRIDSEYPDYIKWVMSGGTTNQDWYLHRR